MGSRDEAGLRLDVVRVCHRLYDRGLIAGPDGNVSARLDDDRILITPSGMSKIDVTAEDLVVIDRRGAIVAGERRPSSELRMHLRMYERRPDVRGVVHAHPPVATGFAVAGESFMAPVLPEVILQMGGANGGVPLVRYATPGGEALADQFDEHLAAGHHAFLMANHGATTIGATLEVAHQRMESLEHAARILLVARSLGTVNVLTAADVKALFGGNEVRS